MISQPVRTFLYTFILTMAIEVIGYPLDGYDYTHIRRLQSANRDTLPAGARLPLVAVIPSGFGVDTLPLPDPELGNSLRLILGDMADQYSIALLDISDPDAPRFAVHNPDMVANIGSVGKLLVLFSLFDRLARLYPDDTEQRRQILTRTMVTADEWITSDHHTVPIFDTDAGRVISRRLQVGDTGNLWEYLDWMASASSNAAASMVVQQTILLEKFGLAYPASADKMRDFLETSSPTQLGRLWLDAMERPLQQAGFDLAQIRQGGPFTATAQRRVNGTTSLGNTTDLIRLLNLIETGRFVDAWSSQEVKRLLYMTQRRIRYASHPVLSDSAVYFKSGSFYSCTPEPGFVCRQYMGNKVNRLASIATIEAPAGSPELRYHVAIMSNVLRINSAVAHQTLALHIHRLLEQRHASQTGSQPVGKSVPNPAPVTTP